MTFTDQSTPGVVGTSRDHGGPPPYGPRRIGLFGNFGTGNIGNEGTLTAMLMFLRRACPDAALTCICPRPDVVRAEHGVHAVPIRSQPRSGRSIWGKLSARIEDFALILRNMRGVDVLIIPGTGILDDFGEPPRGMPLTLFLVTLVARLRRIPVAFVSVGAGPIENSLSRILFKQSARNARYVSFRDANSQNFMRSIGFDVAKTTVYPDLAFSLDEPAQVSERATTAPLTIGVGVMDYRGWGSGGPAAATIYNVYIAKISAFVGWLLKQGYNVRLLVGEASDQTAVDDVLAAVAGADYPPGRIVAEQATSLAMLMRQIKATDAVVATRFHNVLCALKLGIPTLSIGYAKKNDVLQAALGLGEYCRYVETFETAEVISLFERLIADRARLAALAREGSLRFQRRLEEQEQHLTAEILAVAPRAALPA